MSAKERRRGVIMAGVKAGELGLVEAAEVLGLGYRQTRRVWRRYQDQSDAGLVHRLRGTLGKRRKPPERRAKILARVAQRYPDFEPTLAAGNLAKEKLVVDHETLRRWLLAQNQRPVRRKRQRHRQWRERIPCFGAVVHLDGSHHDWFEGRRGQCVLMVMVEWTTRPTGCGRSSLRKRRLTPATTFWQDGAGNTACSKACWWTGTASTAAKGWGASPNRWRAKQRKRNLAARWRSWAWS